MERCASRGTLRHCRTGLDAHLGYEPGRTWSLLRLSEQPVSRELTLRPERSSPTLQRLGLFGSRCRGARFVRTRYLGTRAPPSDLVCGHLEHFACPVSDEVSPTGRQNGRLRRAVRCAARGVGYHHVDDHVFGHRESRSRKWIRGRIARWLPIPPGVRTGRFRCWPPRRDGGTNEQ